MKLEVILIKFNPWFGDRCPLGYKAVEMKVETAKSRQTMSFLPQKVILKFFCLNFYPKKSILC